MPNALFCIERMAPLLNVLTATSSGTRTAKGIAQTGLPLNGGMGISGGWYINDEVLTEAEFNQRVKNV
jgi:hypothetical protein